MKTDTPQPGMVAAWSGDCYRCGDPILRGVSRIVFNRGRALHVECANGADDE